MENVQIQIEGNPTPVCGSVLQWLRDEISLARDNKITIATLPYRPERCPNRHRLNSSFDFQRVYFLRLNRAWLASVSVAVPSRRPHICARFLHDNEDVLQEQTQRENCVPVFNKTHPWSIPPSSGRPGAPAWPMGKASDGFA